MTAPDSAAWRRGRAGFVAIVGRPNVGKSTLLNQLLGFHLAAVSDKPQTTRNRWRGILTDADSQLVFVDTPGAHEGPTRLNDAMLDTVGRAVRDSDLLLVIADPTRGPGEEDDLVARRAAASGRPCLLAVNKIDAATAGEIAASTAFFRDRLGTDTPVFPISAATAAGCDALLAALRERLPEGPLLYAEDDLTDAPSRDIAAELIREAAFELLQEEVPHCLGVDIDRWQDRPKAVRIDATIYIERPTQRAIVIGRDGSMVDAIRRQAIPALRDLTDKRVDLRLFVKVAPDWRNRKSFLESHHLAGPDA